MSAFDDLREVIEENEELTAEVRRLRAELSKEVEETDLVKGLRSQLRDRTSEKFEVERSLGGLASEYGAHLSRLELERDEWVKRYGELRAMYESRGREVSRLSAELMERTDA